MTDQPVTPDARIPKPGAPKKFKCRNCLKVGTKKKPWQKFCNSKCRDTFHNDNKRLEKVEG